MNKNEFLLALEQYSEHVWETTIIPFMAKHELSHVTSQMGVILMKKRGKYVSCDENDQLANELESSLYESVSDTGISDLSWIINGISDKKAKELINNSCNNSIGKCEKQNDSNEQCVDYDPDLEQAKATCSGIL